MFFGREELIDRLTALTRKRTAALVTCRGRRRIGKTTLVETFAKRTEARFLKIEGLRPKPSLSNADELSNFASQLALQTGCDDTPPSNWLNAFSRLDREIRDDTATVVLLDEVSWMANYDPAFPGTLKIAWDNLFKKHDRLVLVVCGSVSTWIRDNIIDDGTFYGRRSLDIVVPELPLSECVKFWGAAAERIDRREILDVLSVTGGIPRYLEEIDPSETAAENIRRLCFSPRGVLREDFDEMFADVITKAPMLASRVLRSLVDGPKSVSEIAAALGTAKGGRFSDVLAQLIESGMVASDTGKNPATSRDMRETRYRIKDNYSVFYLKYVEPVKDAIDKNSFPFGSLDSLDGWDSLMGLAFENLVLSNLRPLLGLLGLGSVQILSAAPFRKKAGKGNGGEGVQIDLLLQARRTACVVEIKRRREIGREIEDEVARKIRFLPKRDGVSIRTALVYEGHLAPIVEADGFFDSVVPFRRLLGI